MSAAAEQLVALEPDANIIAEHLRLLFQGALDHCPGALIQIDTGHPTTDEWDCQLFGLNRLDEAAAFAAAENRRGRNLYVGVNPRRAGTRRSATNADIECAFFHVADIDRPAAVQKVAGMADLNYTFAVTTGRVPNPRPHLYWWLEEPTRNLQAWTRQQRAIADELGGDRVIDPRRIMRLAGTINYPTPEKAQRGYVAELVTLRTLYDGEEREPVDAEWLRLRFPPKQPAVLNLSAGAGTSPDELIARIRTGGGGWHNNMLRLVGHYVAIGLTDETIMLAAEGLTLAPFTVAETRADVATMIRGARAKWDRPNPVIDLMSEDIATPPSLPTIAGGNVGRWSGRMPPAVEFVVADFVPIGMVTIEVGNGSAGKTLLMQTVGTAVVLGVPFLGKATMQGGAVGVFAEDPEEVLHLRQHRLNEHFGTTHSTLAGHLFVQSYFGHDVRLWRDGKPTPFFHDLERQLTELEGVRLLLLDNVALLYSGPEMDRGEVTAFMAALNGLASRRRVAIILSHHGSKSQDGTALRAASGSTAWINAARSVLHLEAAAGDKPPTLTLIKANHAKTGERIELEWRDALLLPQSVPDSLTSRLRSRSLDDEIFERVREGWESGQPYSCRKQAGDRYLPRIIAASGRFRAKDAETAIIGWIASRHLVYDRAKSMRRDGLKVDCERYASPMRQSEQLPT